MAALRCFQSARFTRLLPEWLSKALQYQNSPLGYAPKAETSKFFGVNEALYRRANRPMPEKSRRSSGTERHGAAMTSKKTTITRHHHSERGLGLFQATVGDGRYGHFSKRETTAALHGIGSSSLPTSFLGGGNAGEGINGEPKPDGRKPLLVRGNLSAHKTPDFLPSEGSTQREHEAGHLSRARWRRPTMCEGANRECGEGIQIECEEAVDVG
jgi:hypothetical protein